MERVLLRVIERNFYARGEKPGDRAHHRAGFIGAAASALDPFEKFADVVAHEFGMLEEAAATSAEASDQAAKPAAAAEQ